MAKKKQAGSRARQIKRSKGHIGLGVKIYGGQKVSSGMVIVRQRGTKFYPGKNAAIGKDYTIFSKIEGIVSYRTRDHRQYIDITPQV